MSNNSNVILLKNPSCSCIGINYANKYARGFDYEEDDIDFLSRSQSVRSRNLLRWKGIWRLFVKKKDRKENINNNIASYDLDSYAQNFDDGHAWTEEPEILSRNFSARYASSSNLRRIR